MDNKNFDINKLFKNISDTVDNAVNSKDFKELNQTVQNSINKAVSSVREAVAPPAKPTEQMYTPAIKGTFGSQVYRILGILLATGSGIIALLLLIAILGGVGDAVIKVILAIFVILTGLGIFCSRIAGRDLKLVRRFKEFRQMIGSRTTIAVEELMYNTGAKGSVIIDDIKAMIERRYFLQAHLSDDKKVLFMTNAAYGEYRQRLEDQAREEAQMQASGMTPEVKEVLKQGREYIAGIKEANDRLPGAEISAKLSRLQTVVEKIMNEVKKQPRKADDLATFMNYYLPTTRKLLDAYIEFDAQPIMTENVIQTKKEIEATLDTINQAFENLLDDLIEEKAWDIGAEISVLQTMFKQEGLTEESGAERRTDHE